MTTTYAPPKRRPVAPAAGVTAGALAIMVAFTAAHEGEVRHTYVDHIGRGEPLTYCYGETVGAVAGKTYTHEECLAALHKSALKHAQLVAPCLPAGLPDETAAGFYDIGYNVLGSTSAFCKSSMSRKALAGDLAGACDALLLYNKSKGVDCGPRKSGCYGVWARRLDEHALCLKGLTAQAPAPAPPPAPEPPTHEPKKEHPSWTSSFMRWLRSLL